MLNAILLGVAIGLGVNLAAFLCDPEIYCLDVRGVIRNNRDFWGKLFKKRGVGNGT